MKKDEFIAKVRYLGWICYQMGADLPLHDVPPDYSISKERLESLIEGTNFALNHPNLTAKENHFLWCAKKVKQGYKYGKVLDVEKKTHPSLIPFEELSEVEKRKDEMDILMVQLCSKLYEEVKGGFEDED